jgi:acyl-CoA hydrolase
VLAPDFSALLRDGDTVMWGQASAEPLTLTRALVAQREGLGRLRLFMGVDTGRTFRPEHADHFDFFSYCGAGGNRQLAQAGLLDILPCPYSQIPQVLRSGMLKVDVLLVQVSPANKDGRFSLGVANDLLLAALEVARVVIAEVNPKVPFSHGERTLLESEIDWLVPAQFDPLEILSGEVSPVESRIAAQVASLIGDGATLQLGLGGVAETVLSLLSDRRDLGFHSGIMGDAAVTLAQAGALTNARKGIDLSVSVTGLLMGTQRLYQFAHQNPAVQLRGTDYTHNAQVLRSIHQLVAINSAIEVDLTGQVNAEVAGGVYMGAVGGAPDFLRAAHASYGGIPIVALPATAAGKSRIVSNISGPVSTARCDAGVFVTEHGIADLRGLTLKQRRQRMVDIAAPEHRAALAESGKL